MRAGSKRIKSLETSRFSPLRLEDAPDPGLPTPQWVRVRPLLSGICGSDLGTLSSENSPYFSPLTSPPFVMGHEVVGKVTEDNSGFLAGERVVLEPALGCAVRGIDPPCPYCASGRHALCLNVARGDISPGIQTGFCRDTSGGWSQGTLAAHPSQLHRVPDAVSDEAAVAIEPLACAVHAALGAVPAPGDTTLVIGAGSVGLFTVAVLRRLTDAGRIICVAKHERQRNEAMRLGATEVVHPLETYTKLPEMLGTASYKPELGKPVVMGGAAKVFECVGAPGTTEDALRLARPGGEVTLVGMPGAKSTLDLTRSEEHTSELQSRQYLVCRLLLEKKKKLVSVLSCLYNISFICFCTLSQLLLPYAFYIPVTIFSISLLPLYPCTYYLPLERCHSLP